MKPYGRIVLFGASSGIGLAVAENLASKCEELITVSRRKPPVGQWIQTDVSKLEQIDQLVSLMEGKTIDGLLYLGGTWEAEAFTEHYSFESCEDDDMQNVMDVNLMAPIRLVQRLLPNLKRSKNAKIIVIGAAIGGLNASKSREVANTSSKFGLRGMTLSLRQLLKQYAIGITLIHPGYVATPEVLEDLKESEKDESYSIPLSDVCQVIELVLNTSNRTNITEIDMPSMK